VKNRALFYVVFGFLVMLHFFCPVPILDLLIGDWFLAFFAPYLGFRKIYLLNLILIVLSVPYAWKVLCFFYLKFPLLILMLVPAVPLSALMSTGTTYLVYFGHKKLFRKWFKRMEDLHVES